MFYFNIVSFIRHGAYCYFIFILHVGNCSNIELCFVHNIGWFAFRAAADGFLSWKTIYYQRDDVVQKSWDNYRIIQAGTELENLRPLHIITSIRISCKFYSKMRSIGWEEKLK